MRQGVKVLGDPLEVLVGNEAAVCPYCGGTLPKMPGRKIRCPLCSKSIYTRKRVIDGVKALVTGRDAVVADYQRSLIYLDPGTKATELSRFEIARSELKQGSAQTRSSTMCCGVSSTESYSRPVAIECSACIAMCGFGWVSSGGSKAVHEPHSSSSCRSSIWISTAQPT